jgi:CHAT domain-containing protein
MLQAGARAVLASLWTVDDEATFLLIVRFAQEWFPRMNDEPPAAALARAQRWLRTVTNADLRIWRAAVAAAPPRALVTRAPSASPSDRISSTLERAQKHARKHTRTRATSAFDADVARVMRGTGYWYRRPVSRLDADQAGGEVRARAWEGAGDERPFAEPLFWAGFQVFGW